uniref:DISC1 scaffold protein n=1 Tax=Scleropages formosus TaxID=113540 RepID=A0A8C9TWH7_SCLFO
GLSSRRRLPRRPGYMRADLLGTLQSTAQEDGQRSTLTNGEGRDLSFTLSQQPSRLNVADPTLRDSSGLRSKPRFDPGTHVAPLSPNQHSAKRDRFNSSFSFIRLSLNSAQGMDGSTGSPEQSEDRPVSPGKWGPVFVPSGQLEPACPSLKPGLAHSTDSSSLPVSPEVERSICPEPWREPPAGPADRRDALPDADSCSLDAEASSSLSVDSSDAASGSSVTSGYESATPCSDRAWEALAKKYESVLQDSLQSNRTNAKIESMMLKLQRLQQKAVLEDDYDTAEHFGNKLEELRRERGSLTLGLPSRHPTVERFLGRLRVRVRSAMQGAAGHPSHLEVLQRPLLRREQLRKEKQLVEDEMRELQRRLAELRERNAQLDRDLEQEEYLLEGEEDEGPALSGCSPTQLHELSRALEDTVTSQHRAQICTNLPLPVLRLQERERTLNTSIKEATAKVVMSQRLGGSLRRKVSESETQLLALHEAKIAAISGNDFSSAKELKAEMKCAYGERERLEGLLKRLQVLSAGNSRELAHMKEEQLLVKQELARREVHSKGSLMDRHGGSLGTTGPWISSLFWGRLLHCGSRVARFLPSPTPTRGRYFSDFTHVRTRVSPSVCCWSTPSSSYD